MLYRAIFGIVPMILIALFASGAIRVPGMPNAKDASEVVEVIKAIDSADDSGVFRETARRPGMSEEEARRLRQRRQTIQRMRADGSSDGKGWAPNQAGWGR